MATAVYRTNTSNVSSQIEELGVFAGTQISRTLATAVVRASQAYGQL